MLIQLLAEKRPKGGFKATLKIDGKRKGTLYPKDLNELDLLSDILEEGVIMVRNNIAGSQFGDYPEDMVFERE